MHIARRLYHLFEILMRTCRNICHQLAIFVSLVCLLYPVSLLAQQMPTDLAAVIAKYGISLSAVSLDIHDIETGKPVVQLNSNRPRNPASVIKLVTTLSALEILGPHHTWKTKYLIDGEIKDGVLVGNLVMQGGGDPFLTMDRFWHQIMSIKQRGIHTITGDFVIDNSLFAVPGHDRNAFDGKGSRLYNVGPDAALVNFSATRFVFHPIGNEIAVFSDPPLAGLVVDNNIKPAQGKCKSRNGGWSYALDIQQDKVIARFNGTYRSRCGQHSVARALFPNPEYTYRLFKYLWQSNGGTFNGGFHINKTPEDAVGLIDYPSEPLADIITSINKFSNNVMARILLLSIDAEREGEPATIDGARKMIGDWMTVNGLPMPELFIDNGSGLSRKSKITTANLSDLLGHAWNSNYRAEFLSSLSLAALDGTMRKRLKNSPLRSRARIKTGLITGVRSMAGYVNAKNNKQYAVAMMIESGKVNFWNGNVIQDAVLNWVYNR